MTMSKLRFVSALLTVLAAGSEAAAEPGFATPPDAFPGEAEEIPRDEAPYGIAVPKTWDEYVAAAEKLHAAHVRLKRALELVQKLGQARNAVHRQKPVAHSEQYGLLPAGAIPIPGLSFVDAEDPGTALEVDVGYASNPDALADGIALSSGGHVLFTSGTMPADALAPQCYRPAARERP